MYLGAELTWLQFHELFPAEALVFPFDAGNLEGPSDTLRGARGVKVLEYERSHVVCRLGMGCEFRMVAVESALAGIGRRDYCIM